MRNLLMLILLFTPFVLPAQEAYNNFYNITGIENYGSVAGQISMNDTVLVATGIAASVPFTGQELFMARFALNGDYLGHMMSGVVNANYHTQPCGGIARLSDGNFVVVGYYKDFEYSDTLDHVYYPTLTKFTPAGDTLFTRHYKINIGTRRFFAIQETADGGYMISGSKAEGPIKFPTANSIIYRDNSVWLIKTDSIGKIEWDSTYYTHSNYDESSIFAEAMAPSTDGGHVIGTTRYYGNNDRSTFIFKIDSLGKVLWETKVGSPFLDYPKLNIVRGKTGGYLFVANYTGKMGVHGPNTYPDDMQLFFGKLDEKGDTLWTKRFNIPGDTIGHTHGLDIEELPNGDIVMLGMKADSTFKALLLKTDATGNIKWHRQYWTYNLYTVENIPHDMALGPNGDIFFTGEIRSGFYYPPLVDTVGQYAWLVRTDSMGCLEPGCHLQDTTGIQKIVSLPPGMAMQVYPNPAREELQVLLKESVPGATLELVNMQGQTVIRQPTEQIQHHRLQVAALPQGLYLLRLVKDGQQVAVEKVVVE